MKYAAAGRINEVLKSNFIFSPHNYSQSLMVYNLLASLVKQKIEADKIAVLDISISKMEEIVKKEGANQQEYIAIAKAYDKKAQVLKKPEIYKISEEYYKKAIDLGPNRLEPHFSYGLSLVKQGRNEEALKLFNETFSLEERAPLSNFYLGLALSMQNRSSYKEAFEHMEFFFASGQRNPDIEASKGAYQKFLSYFIEIGDKDKVLTSVMRLSELDSSQKETYLKIADYIKKTGKIPKLDITVE